MNNQEFLGRTHALREHAKNLLHSKNAKYAGNYNPIHNFEIGAAINGSTTAQTAWGYMTKHLVALQDMVKRNDFSDLPDLLEKCTDITNYIAFIYAIGIDENEKLTQKGSESNDQCHA